MHTQQLRACKYDYVCIPTPKVLTKAIDTTRLAQCSSTRISLQSATTHSLFAYSESTQDSVKFAVPDCRVNLETYLLEMQESRYMRDMLEPFASSNSSV